jgi:hypothetical protein
MTMSLHRVLPLLAALLLGAGASVLAACGEGPSSGIPATNADALNRDLDAVQQAVADGRCERAQAALTRVRGQILNLPSSTSDRLVARLQQGADNLEQRIPSDCEATATTTQTDTTPTQTTTTDTTPTQTTPTQTTTTDTTPTQTTTTDTTPTQTTPTTPTTTGGTGTGTGTGNGNGNGNGKGTGGQGNAGGTGGTEAGTGSTGGTGVTG